MRNIVKTELRYWAGALSHCLSNPPTSFFFFFFSAKSYFSHLGISELHVSGSQLTLKRYQTKNKNHFISCQTQRYNRIALLKASSYSTIIIMSPNDTTFTAGPFLWFRLIYC